LEQNRRFEETLDSIKELFLDNILTRSKRNFGLNVLDLMSGWGRSAQVLYKWFNKNMTNRNKKGGTLHLVDYAKQMLEKAKVTVYETGPVVHYHHLEVQAIEWNTFQIKFDVIIGWWTLSYLITDKDKKGFFQGIKLVLA
jgi:ubiquinone/menaquinone biosynthesis C-methylase UbiE